MTELICIVCPKGCHLKVDEDNNYKVTGNSCKRGEEYGKKELTNPTRVITSTVKINKGTISRLPVKTNSDIKKSQIKDAMKLLDNMSVNAPIKVGDIIIKNILNSGVDFVATKTIKSI